ncbi:MAG TPA: hypothetical protein VHA77_10295 [Xanthobacteraceae bacterium]|nr:hypothetical protein [Xanthobacteraceae bacterium]
MERLHFVCPQTGRDVDVGIETELGTLLRIRLETVRAKCPACGLWHEWVVRDAKLPAA